MIVTMKKPRRWSRVSSLFLGGVCDFGTDIHYTSFPDIYLRVYTKRMELPYTAPTFTLPDINGKIHTLDEYKGKWVILYFYPKDDTAGCTAEACSLRDARDTLA